MSDRVADHVVSLIRHLLRHLNCRIIDAISVLLNHKSAVSVGAIVGFAIADIFAWKFLRSSSGRRASDRRKRRAEPSTSQTAAGDEASGSGRLAPAVPLEAPVALQPIASPVELTLGEIVRKRLGCCRKMSSQLLGEKTPQDLQKHATVRLPVLAILEEISKFCDLYLMETVFDDENEERILSALENAGVFQTGSLIKDKVLFCSTDTGRTSFVRQLEADWHIDTNLEVTSQLSRFIRNELYIANLEPGRIAPNVFTSAGTIRFLIWTSCE